MQQGPLLWALHCAARCPLSCLHGSLRSFYRRLLAIQRRKALCVTSYSRFWASQRRGWVLPPVWRLPPRARPWAPQRRSADRGAQGMGQRQGVAGSAHSGPEGPVRPGGRAQATVRCERSRGSAGALVLGPRVWVSQATGATEACAKRFRRGNCGRVRADQGFTPAATACSGQTPAAAQVQVRPRGPLPATA